MEDTENGLDLIMTAMRLLRVQHFEWIYYLEHDGALDDELISKYFCILKDALGDDGAQSLDNYTDCLIGRNKTDESHYYDHGFDDCQKLYSKLYGIAPVCNIKGNGDEWEDNNPDLQQIVSIALSDDKLCDKGKAIIKAAGDAWGRDG
jgi:hypothetical protein